MFVEIFFNMAFQVKFSSNSIPKILITGFLFIIVSLIINLGNLSGMKMRRMKKKKKFLLHLAIVYLHKSFIRVKILSFLTIFV